MANIIAAWISPLNHAAYAMHNFGYGNFPSIMQSHLVFLILNIVLLACSYRIVKKSEIMFSGGSHD